MSIRCGYGLFLLKKYQIRGTNKPAAGYIIIRAPMAFPSNCGRLGSIRGRVTKKTLRSFINRLLGFIISISQLEVSDFNN